LFVCHFRNINGEGWRNLDLPGGIPIAPLEILNNSIRPLHWFRRYSRFFFETMVTMSSTRPPSTHSQEEEK
jgi:hypothetical protein